MTHVNYLVTRFVTEDPVNQRKLNRLAKELQDQLDTIVLDAGEIGQVKVDDLEYEINDPSGHTHSSTRMQACEFCTYNLANDGVHPSDE